MLLIIAGAFILTWLIRTSPFILLAKVELPDVVIKWLAFIPVCLFTALIVEGMLKQEKKTGYFFEIESIIVAIPTLFVALVSKSLTITVIAGMIFMASVRFIM